MPGLSKVYITEIKPLKKARAKAYNAVNYTMIESYWLIGSAYYERNSKRRTLGKLWRTSHKKRVISPHRQISQTLSCPR